MSQKEGSKAEQLKGTALELFEGLADSYERALDVATLLQDRYWKRWVVEKSRALKSQTILDVGCGTLLLEERLRSAGCTMVGVDLTGQMIKIGQSKRLPNVPILVNGDAESLPFRDSSFDSVLSCYVAKYVDLDKFTSELARVAKPGARLVLYDFIRPTGPFLPFLALYVYGVMRIAGFLLGLAKTKEAFTFNNLPRLVGGAIWDGGIVGTFARHGVWADSTRRLSGGIVMGYVGVKGRENEVKEASP